MDPPSAIVSFLRKAGLVKSTRGQKGGYRLACPPDQMNLGMVLAALGGRLYSKDFCGRHAGKEQVLALLSCQPY